MHPRRALKAGALGYLSKRSAAEELRLPHSASTVSAVVTVSIGVGWAVPGAGKTAAGYYEVPLKDDGMEVVINPAWASKIPADVMTPPVTASPRSIPCSVPYRWASSRTRAIRKML